MSRNYCLVNHIEHEEQKKCHEGKWKEINAQNNT